MDTHLSNWGSEGLGFKSRFSAHKFRALAATQKVAVFLYSNIDSNPILLDPLILAFLWLPDLIIVYFPIGVECIFPYNVPIHFLLFHTFGSCLLIADYL